MTIHVRPLPDGGWEARGTQDIAVRGPTRDEAVQAFCRVLTRHARSAFPVVDASASAPCIRCHGLGVIAYWPPNPAVKGSNIPCPSCKGIPAPAPATETNP